MLPLKKNYNFQHSAVIFHKMILRLAASSPHCFTPPSTVVITILRVFIFWKLLYGENFSFWKFQESERKVDLAIFNIVRLSQFSMLSRALSENWYRNFLTVYFILVWERCSSSFNQIWFIKRLIEIFLWQITVEHGISLKVEFLQVNESVWWRSGRWRSMNALMGFFTCRK